MFSIGVTTLDNYFVYHIYIYVTCIYSYSQLQLHNYIVALCTPITVLKQALEIVVSEVKQLGNYQLECNLSTEQVVHV